MASCGLFLAGLGRGAAMILEKIRKEAINADGEKRRIVT
jgi:hypothetical protein